MNAAHEFPSWGDDATRTTIVDEGDSVTLRVESRTSGMTVCVESRIAPQDIDRLIAVLAELKARHG